MQNRSKIKYTLTTFLFTIWFLFFTNLASSQCAMCRASLQGEQNIAKAEAVNDGIVYLMVIPYLLVAIMGFIIYRLYTSNKK